MLIVLLRGQCEIRIEDTILIRLGRGNDLDTSTSTSTFKVWYILHHLLVVD